MSAQDTIWTTRYPVNADAMLLQGQSSTSAAMSDYSPYFRPSKADINLHPLLEWTANHLLNDEVTTSNAAALYEPLLNAQGIYLLLPARAIYTASDVPLGSLAAPEPPKTQSDLAIRQLLQLAELPYNWDGCGAEKPNKDSIREARRFVRALAPESRVPRPTLHANGDALLFFRDDDGYTEIEFYNNRRFGYYARRGNREWAGEDIYFDGFELPIGLKEIGLLTKPRYLLPERSAGM